MQPTPLLTTDELAQYLGLEAGAIRTRLHRGQDLPPYIKLGRQYRWRLEDVDAWLKSRLVHSVPRSPRPAREVHPRRTGRPRNSRPRSFPESSAT